MSELVGRFEVPNGPVVMVLSAPEHLGPGVLLHMRMPEADDGRVAEVYLPTEFADMLAGLLTVVVSPGGPQEYPELCVCEYGPTRWGRGAELADTCADCGRLVPGAVSGGMDVKTVAECSTRGPGCRGEQVLYGSDGVERLRAEGWAVAAVRPGLNRPAGPLDPMRWQCPECAAARRGEQ